MKKTASRKYRFGISDIPRSIERKGVLAFCMHFYFRGIWLVNLGGGWKKLCASG
jgi:hypothetical protein